MNNIDLTQFELPMIPQNPSGTARDELNGIFSVIQTDLNLLAARIADINTKSAVVRKYAPVSGDVFVGALVYWNGDNSRFEPAQALLSTEPTVLGGSVEAECARVEGMVIAIDELEAGLPVMATLLCGGYWENTTAIASCLPAGAVSGTYYLSPTDPGRAVASVQENLRQPVLTYYGGSAFSLGIYCMARQFYHGHSSCVLQGIWQDVSTLPEDVSEAPTGARFWYTGTVADGQGGTAPEAAYEDLGAISDRTTAIFRNGVLQNAADGFILQDGYLWYTGTPAPAAGTVTLFNNYPFTYGNAVVRSIESANDAIVVNTRNGRVKLTAHEFAAGSVALNAYAVSAISNNTVLMTPVVSGISAGPGMAVSRNLDGTVVVSAADRLGAPVDAYSVHHLQTNQTCDGRFMYLTFPKGRDSSLVIDYPVNGVPGTTVQQARVWCEGVGAGGATFDVSYYWVPAASASGESQLPSGNPVISTMSFSASEPGSLVYAEANAPVQFSGNGLLSAVVHISAAPTADVRLLRIGFRLEVVSAAVATPDVNDVTEIQQLVNTGTAVSSISKYSCVKVSGAGLATCMSNNAGDCDRCLGIALETVSTGDVQYIMQGIIQDSNFNFTAAGDIYIGPTGALTQVDPATDTDARFIQRVGVALTSAIIQIDIKPGTLKEQA